MINIINELLNEENPLETEINVLNECDHNLRNIGRIIPLARAKYPLILLQCPGIRERMITACYRNTIQCDTSFQLIAGIYRLAPHLSIVVSTFFSADQRYIKNTLDTDHKELSEIPARSRNPKKDKQFFLKKYSCFPKAIWAKVENFRGPPAKNLFSLFLLVF